MANLAAFCPLRSPGLEYGRETLSARRITDSAPSSSVCPINTDLCFSVVRWRPSDEQFRRQGLHATFRPLFRHPISLSLRLAVKGF